MGDALRDPASGQPRPRPIPLQAFELPGKPTAQHAVVWSPDAELAVAVDDSVYVHAPRFIDMNGDAMPVFERDKGNGSTSGSSDPDGPDTGSVPNHKDAFSRATESRSQFSSGFLRIPVGSTGVDQRLNNRLFEFSLISPNPPGVPPGPHAPGTQQVPTSSYGGSLLADSKSTLGSVVRIAWSPVGVGRHNHTVLGILTTSGILRVCGEDLDGYDKIKKKELDSDGRLRGEGRTHYDMSRWEMLWAAGGDMEVPGARCRDRIVSFAWSNACDRACDFPATGKRNIAETRVRALLVYVTDKNHLVVLAIGHHHDLGGAMTWYVAEVARSYMSSPHSNQYDQTSCFQSPIPAAHAEANTHRFSSAFGVECSSWLAPSLIRNPKRRRDMLDTCIVAYSSENYVGFRRITIMPPESATNDPNNAGSSLVWLDCNDTMGTCLHGHPDAFLKFEEGPWEDEIPNDTWSTQDEIRLLYYYRVMIVSIYGTRTVSVPVHFRNPYEHARHNEHLLPFKPHVFQSSECSPIMESDNRSYISALVVHTPRQNNGLLLYTMLKWPCFLAGTEINMDTNLTRQQLPQWTNDLQNIGRLNLWRPVDIFGLDQAPGALPGTFGVTALFAGYRDDMSTVHPKNGQKGKGSVFFGYQNMPSDDEPETMQAEDGPSSDLKYCRPPLSTEAQMWTYMYGGGPPVLAKAPSSDDWPRGLRENINQLFTGTCSICDMALTMLADLTCVCSQNHRFDRCSATGLVIDRPNISHACGVCGHRALRLDALVLKLHMFRGPMPPDMLLKLRWDVLGDNCKRCGGKFFD